jgi:hypothetical protein
MDHPAFDLSRGDRTIPAELASVEALELRIWDVGFDRFEDFAVSPNLVQLEGLSGLERLEALTLESLPSWDASRKRQVVKSFRPLAAIEGLQSLRLNGGVRSGRRSIPARRAQGLAGAVDRQPVP